MTTLMRHPEAPSVYEVRHDGEIIGAVIPMRRGFAAVASVPRPDVSYHHKTRDRAVEAVETMAGVRIPEDVLIARPDLFGGDAA